MASLLEASGVPGRSSQDQGRRCWNLPCLEEAVGPMGCGSGALGLNHSVELSCHGEGGQHARKNRAS
jgi:hypothetical protein